MIVYAENEADFVAIKKEQAAYEELNIPYELIDDIPLVKEGYLGLRVDQQFELNPVKYVDFLLSYLQEQGVAIFQQTEAEKVVKDDEQTHILTANKKVISCQDVVIATGYLFYEGKGLFFTRLKALRSYLLAFPVEASVAENFMMISNAKNAHSLRFSETDGTHYLLVGGRSSGGRSGL